ncbi:MAG: hypothetical protein H6825_09965 [Planctomycetes bacterium]|nr:hypothetical protein [Planctomycetota bacterium]
MPESTDPAPRRPWPRALLAAVRMVLPLLTLALPARAHTPHDTVETIEISPSFDEDGTAFGVFRLSEHVVFARTTNGGKSWQEWGHEFVQSTVAALRFSPDFLHDRTAFAAAVGSGVWRTTDGGTTWTHTSAGLGDVVVHDLAVSPDFPTSGRLLAATDDGCFLSTDRGEHWARSDDGLAESVLIQITFAGPTGRIAYTGTKVLQRSDDGGATWRAGAKLSDPLHALEASPSFATDATLAAVVGGEGVFVSTDAGATFQPSNTGLRETAVNDLEFADDGTLVAALPSKGIATCPGPFTKWTISNAGLEELTPQTANHWRDVEITPTFSRDGVVLVGSFEGVFRSDDRGQTFRQSDIYHQHINRALVFSPDYVHDHTILLGNYGGGVFLSPDDGDSWEPVLGASTPGTMGSGHAGGAPTGAVPGIAEQTPSEAGAVPFPRIDWTARADGITSTYTGPLTLSPSFATDDTLFYGHVGLWRSETRGRTWTKLTVPSSVVTVRGLGVSPDFDHDHTLFIGSAESSVERGSTTSGAVFRSTDAGDTWQLVVRGLSSDFRSREFAFSPAWTSDHTVFVASRNLGCGRSTDGGDTWQLVQDGLTSLIMRVIAISPDFVHDRTVFLGAQDGGVQRTRDGGDTWEAVNVGIADAAGIDIEGLALSPDYAHDHTLFCASQRSGVYRSTDGGDSWTPVGEGLPLAMPRVMAISPDFVHDRTVLLSTHDWIWRSSDAGEHWSRMPGYVRVPDNHDQVAYEQTWRRSAAPDSHGGSISSSDTADDAFSYEFFGDSVTWYAVRDDGSGQAEVSLDGDVAALVDLYSPRGLYQQAVFEHAFGESAWHTIRVRVTDTKNRLSLGTNVRSDGFSYTF